MGRAYGFSCRPGHELAHLRPVALRDHAYPDNRPHLPVGKIHRQTLCRRGHQRGSCPGRGSGLAEQFQAGRAGTRILPCPVGAAGPLPSPRSRRCEKQLACGIRLSSPECGHRVERNGAEGAAACQTRQGDGFRPGPQYRPSVKRHLSSQVGRNTVFERKGRQSRQRT